MTNLKSVWPSLFKSTKAMTMNQAKLMEEYEATKAHLESLDKLLEATSKYLQRTKVGESYYFVGASWASPIVDHEAGHKVDRTRESMGNYFLGESHAEALLSHRSRWGKLERLLIEFNDGWEPDWSNEDQTKGMMAFNHKTGRWVAVRSHGFELQGAIYFDSSRKDELIELLSLHFPDGL